jgi:branched-chain amino acid aminotransferase
VILWVDGALVDEREARVSPLDHGLMVGDGVFETLRVDRGVPFAWTRHLDRLIRSAAGLGLAPPPGATLRAAADAVIAANRLGDARLRITVTGGPAPLGSERGDRGPTVIVAGAPMPPWPPVVDVVTVPWTRNECAATAGLKTISYADNVRALAYAHERGGSEAIFANTAGDLCEGTGSNVFCAHDGTLRTPPLRSGCLPGVTRALVLDLCARHHVPVAEAALSPDALATAEEAFLTSSTRDVQPIARVDGRALPAAPGPLTARAVELFSELLRQNPDP